MSANASPPRLFSQLPRAVPFIIGNEGCERFSFYGMRNILTVFLSTSLLLSLPAHEREAAAKEVFHTFVIGVYFFPLLGGWIADRFLGKYRSILYFSLIYCAGHALLALFENERIGFYAGLLLIALGSGGIKPLVSSFVGDQFDQGNRHLAKWVFDAFYWIINFGSFFASLLMPLLLLHCGPKLAFGVPGALMLLATLVFWLGRKHYAPEPQLTSDPHSFARVIQSALLAKNQEKKPGLWLACACALLAFAALLLTPQLGVVAALCMALVLLLVGAGCGAWLQLDAARSEHPDDAVDGAGSVLKVLLVFAMTTPFFSLFDQKASTWVLQGVQMSKPSWFAPSQMQALNPLLVMLLLPFNNLILFPFLQRRGLKLTALLRMSFGIAISAIAWIVVGGYQLLLDRGDALSITWQVVPYALLTMGEVLVSATGLEFAYSQAPARLKGVVMSFWNLTTTVGNLWVLLMGATVKHPSVSSWVSQRGVSVVAFQMFFFAGFALLAALVFWRTSRGYKEQSHYRAA